MSEATNLLNAMVTGAGTAGAGASEEHIVIGADRFITVPESLKKLAVQYDHNVETVTFDCPRYWDDHDMSGMKVYINVRRSDGQLFTCNGLNVRTDASNSKLMHFDWTITREVTAAVGFISFLVCIKEVDLTDSSNPIVSTHWNSELNDDCFISDGLETSDVISNTEPAILAGIYDRLLALEATVGDGNDSSLDSRITYLEGEVYELINVPISITSFSPITSVYEAGTTVTEVRFNWSTNKTPTTIAIKYGSSSVLVDASLTSYTLTGLSLTSNTVFTLEVTEDGKTVTRSTAISFINNVSEDTTGTGIYFTPYVENGVLKWNNNGDMTNPDDLDVKKIANDAVNEIVTPELINDSVTAETINNALTTEEWTFTLEDGTTVTKNVVVK